MKKILFPMLFSALVLIVGSGCIREEEPPMKVALGVPAHPDLKFPPVNNAKDLQLKMISSKIIFAGEKCVLTFALSNTGVRRITIREWFNFEPDNLIISIQPRTTEMNAPDPSNWTELTFEPKRPVFHHPLILMPGNQALIAKEIGFMRDLHVSEGKERRFYIKAETTLKSLKLSTPVIELRVFPHRLNKNI